jgi:mRNA interferase MazF
MISGLGHGQLWWADLPGQHIRPVIVLTRARVAARLRRVLVAPVTTTVRGLSTEVAVGAAEGLRDGSVVNLDNAQLLDTELLLRRAGSLAPDRWPEVCSAMARVLDCPRRL